MVQEEQEEETAKEEGDEMKALKRVFLVSGSWRGSHVLGDPVSCPECERAK